MAYKIVQSVERKRKVLSGVPNEWEDNDVLRWPRNNADKLIRIAGTRPKDDWFSMSCKVKRRNVANYDQCQLIINEMVNRSDTETDIEEDFRMPEPRSNFYSNNAQNYEFLIQDCLRDRGNESNKEEVYVTNCNNRRPLSVSTIPSQYDNISSGALAKTVGADEMQENDVLCQPVEARHVENALIEIQPSATNTDFNAQQHVTTEVQIDNASLTLMVLAKIETLQENYKTLNEKITESIKAQQDDRKFISESVQSILLGLSNISVQFEHVMNQFGRAENNQRKANIQTIASENDLNNFEKALEKPEVEEDWKNKLSIICGKGKGRGVDNAYALVDSMFSRSFLLQCSWAGGSRTSEQKICFKSHTKIINLFFDIIHESDSSYTLLDCHKFFKCILKNSRQRNESKQERTSRTKNRPKLKAKRKNLCNGNQPSLPITGLSAPENRSEVLLPTVGTSGPEKRSEVSLPVVGKSGPEYNEPMSSASAARIPTEPLETSV